jgi:hypothetical protein
MINPHLIKRFLIVLGYLALFSVISFLLYLMISPKATCVDGKKNQGEKEIDCGGPCSPCRISYVEKDFIVDEKTFVSGGNNTYDALVKISNLNDTVGASSFHYTITLRNDSGAALATKEGDDYILPADSRYVAKLGITTLDNETPTQIDFSVGDIKWTELGNIRRPQLSVYNRKFGPDTGGVGSKAEGMVRNEGIDDFRKIDLVVILRDENGKVLGLSTTQKDNLRSGMEGSFVLTWPYTFPSVVRSMEVDAQANVFDIQNFSAGL